MLERGYIPEGVEELQLRLEAAGAVLEGTPQAKNVAELAEDLELARWAQAFAGGFARLSPNDQELTISRLERGRKTAAQAKLLDRLTTMETRTRSVLERDPLAHAARVGAVEALSSCRPGQPRLRGGDVKFSKDAPP